MLDPEFADARVAMGEGEAIGGFWVGEAGGVEIEAQAVSPLPNDPAGEMLGLDLVAVHFFFRRTRRRWRGG